MEKKNQIQFTLTPLQEKFMEYLLGDDSKKIIWINAYNCQKQAIQNEFACHKLCNMKVGERFALVTINGIKVFELVKDSKYE